MFDRSCFVSLVLIATSARAANVGSTFVLYDAATGKAAITNPAMADAATIPCSTFKIPNTLIGLTTGVIPDEKFSLKWDGVKRHIPDWNRDQDLASALRYSVLWFYQEVARRIGAERMQHYLQVFDYGNQSICCAIDEFWLNGKLRISPRQQVDFLRRMAAGTLPVKREHVALVRRLLTIEASPEYTLQGKTGTCAQDGRGVAWLVGFVVRGGHQFVYAFLEVTTTEELTPSREQRIERTKQLLVDRGVLPRR